MLYRYTFFTVGQRALTVTYWREILSQGPQTITISQSEHIALLATPHHDRPGGGIGRVVPIKPPAVATHAIRALLRT